MNFSIVFPSRERVGLLTDLLRSIGETTADITNVEVLVGIDHDDSTTCAAAGELSLRYPFARFHPRSRSTMLNRDYINEAYATLGTGRFVIVGNDDAYFRTPHWDTLALDKLTAYLADKPDGIVYGYIADAILNRHGMGYCCFPLISRAGYLALGWLMPPDFASWNADIVCWRTYSSVGRLCDLSDIMIEHVSYHSGKRDRDHISHHVENIYKQCNLHANYNIDGYVSQLQQAITNGTPCLH